MAAPSCQSAAGLVAASTGEQRSDPCGHVQRHVAQPSGRARVRGGLGEVGEHRCVLDGFHEGQVKVRIVGAGPAQPLPADAHDLVVEPASVVVECGRIVLAGPDVQQQHCEWCRPAQPFKMLGVESTTQVQLGLLHDHDAGTGSGEGRRVVREGAQRFASVIVGARTTRHGDREDRHVAEPRVQQPQRLIEHRALRSWQCDHTALHDRVDRGGQPLVVLIAER